MNAGEWMIAGALWIIATAYDDGKASSVKVQKGRNYLTTVSKRKIGFK